MDNDFVKDEEILYRSLPYNKKDYYTIKEGELKISSQAFGDRTMQPSVDRADLCDRNPQKTQHDPRDGVLSLICKDIRMIDDVVKRDEKGNEQLKYKIDVIPRPLENNIAHAQIEPSPEYQNKSNFRKVQERLAKLASDRINKQGWEIKPK